MNLNDPNFRKMSVTIGLMLTAISTTFLKGDIPPGLLSFMETVFAAYIFGEAAQHGITTYGNTKTTPTGKEDNT